ncbi:unnamed protein product, partial [Ectocarpus sp. 12 AP-2014]
TRHFSKAVACADRTACSASIRNQRKKHADENLKGGKRDASW